MRPRRTRRRLPQLLPPRCDGYYSISRESGDYPVFPSIPLLFFKLSKPPLLPSTEAFRLFMMKSFREHMEFALRLTTLTRSADLPIEVARDDSRLKFQKSI